MYSTDARNEWLKALCAHPKKGNHGQAELKAPVMAAAGDAEGTTEPSSSSSLDPADTESPPCLAAATGTSPDSCKSCDAPQQLDPTAGSLNIVTGKGIRQQSQKQLHRRSISTEILSSIGVSKWDLKLELVSRVTPFPSIPKLFKFSRRVSHSLCSPHPYKSECPHSEAPLALGYECKNDSSCMKGQDPDLPQLPEPVLLHCCCYFCPCLQDREVHVKKADPNRTAGNRPPCGLLGHRKGKSPPVTYVSACEETPIVSPSYGE